MPPIEMIEKLSIPEDRNGSANSNSFGSLSFEHSEVSSASSPSRRSPEESALMRMFQEHSINIPNLYDFSNSVGRNQRMTIPREQTLLDMLRLASNGEEVFSLREVNLRVVASTVSLNRIGLYCPRIRRLQLDGSILSSLRDIGTSLRHLKILHVSRCGLTSLDGTFGLTSLEELHAADNTVDHLGPCAALQNIRVINIERNRIMTLNTISFLSICPKLVDLNISDNSVCRQQNYKESILNMLPNLRMHDGKALFHKSASSEVEDNVESESESVSYSIEVSSMTEPNSEDYQETLDDCEPEVCLGHVSTQEQMKNASFKVRAGRPATCSGIGFRRPLPLAVAFQQRPKSANVKKNYDSSTDNLDTKSIDDDIDTSPSILTSGNIVCGNISRALARSKSIGKKVPYTDAGTEESSESPDIQKSLWSLRDCQIRNEFLFCSLPTKTKSKKNVDVNCPKFEAANKLLKAPLPLKPQETTPVVELEFGVTGINCEDGNTSDSMQSHNEVLKASKMWRKAFKLYRTRDELRLGHCLVAEHLCRLNILPSPECAYGEDVQTIDHVLFGCPLNFAYDLRLPKDCPLPVNAIYLLSHPKEYCSSITKFLKYNDLKLIGSSQHKLEEYSRSSELHYHLNNCSSTTLLRMASNDSESVTGSNDAECESEPD